jgi:cytochrome c oxidase assembly protein Cox11
MHKESFERKIYIIFLLIWISMFSCTLLVIPLYKYLCMVVDNNNNIPDSSDYHALLEYYLESFLNFEEKATRILKWNDFEKKEELQWWKDMAARTKQEKIFAYETCDIEETFFIEQNFWSFFSKCIRISELKITEASFFYYIKNGFLYIDQILNDFLTWSNMKKDWLMLHLLSKSGNIGFLEFKPLQESVYIIPGETILVFFRLFNPTYYEVTCISYYLVFPMEYSIYIHKLQCFCFNVTLINHFETLELPVLFYLDWSIYYSDTNDQNIYIYYIIMLLNTD